MRVVVGSGIIGLSCAYHLAERGETVTVVDAGRPKASLGNAGGIAVTECLPASVPGLWRKVPRWLLDPLGPLHLRPGQVPQALPWFRAFLAAGNAEQVKRSARALAALNDRVYPALEPMLAAIGIASHLHRMGALTVYRDEAARAADALEREIKAANGVRMELVGRGAIDDLEPAVGPAMRCGVFEPDWSHVNDPAAIVHALEDHLLQRGVGFVAGEVRAIARGAAGAAGVELADGRRLGADAVIVAAGAWSAGLARTVGDRALLESERGYNKTIANPGIEIRREVIFGAEKFVATPLAIGLRIGGAAEFAGLDAPPNYKRAERLVALARRGLPDLKDEGGTVWMGHRPSTPDSLPVIGESPRLGRLFYAFGHGHLGLTQSAPTGRIVADLVMRRAPEFDLSSYRIGRF